MESFKMKYPSITFTCTTSKRFDLYVQMMISFFYSCLDMDLIENYIIVDDGSPINEIHEMGRLFPKTNVIKNTKGGQLNSIKMILDCVDTEYMFHSEDDWNFLIQDHYIRKGFDIMHTDSRIKQVTLRFWECMYINDDGLEYRMHNYSPMDIKEDYDIIKYSDCNYGGLTLNPSLIHVPTFKECMKNVHQENSESRIWDKKLSMNYWNAGYKRANLNDEYIEHTGTYDSRYPRINA